MRTTVDIPDALYRELKTRAAREGTSMKEIILRSVMSDVRKSKPAAPRKS
jgi:plasmid stability protein